MSKIGSITNENKLVEKKVNFFIDWFLYFLDNLGANKEFEVENPLSLVDKILFQLMNGLPGKKLPYITNYLSHNYFQEDEYFNSFTSYEGLKPFIVQFTKLSGKEKQKFIENSEAFVKALVNVKEQLQSEMFKFSLSSLISYFQCKDDLEVHKNDIKYHTRILITEYLFQYHKVDDLEKIFKKISSKKLDEFPFPSTIKTKRDKRKYIDAANLKQQCEGLLNWLHTPLEKVYYIFKVYGVNFDDVVFFKYNEVTFYSKGHKKFSAIKENISKKVPYYTYFDNNQNFILASVRMEHFSEEAAIIECRRKVETELKYLSWRLKVNLTIDTTTNYLSTKNFRYFGWHLSTEPFYKNFQKDVLATLNDNPFTVLNKVSNDAKAHLLKHEYLYVDAVKSKNVADLWHYLEVLLSIKDKGKEVKNILSTVILNNELLVSNRRILSKLYYEFTPLLLNAKALKVDFEEAKEICASLRKRKISKLLSAVEYPFVRELVATYKKGLTKEDYLVAYNNYFSILSEAYEQRNFFVHQANMNERALIKLEFSFYEIIKRFRWAIIAEIRKHKSITFSKVISNVLDSGNLLRQ